MEIKNENSVNKAMESKPFGEEREDWFFREMQNYRLD